MINNDFCEFSEKILQFIKINKRVTFISKLLLIYSQFWSASFSIVFLTAIIGTCYCMYCLFFLENLHFLEKSIFVIAPIQVMSLLFFVTQQCSLIVQNNAKIIQQNSVFYKNFSKTSCAQNFSNRYLIKVKLVHILIIVDVIKRFS